MAVAARYRLAAFVFGGIAACEPAPSPGTNPSPPDPPGWGDPVLLEVRASFDRAPVRVDPVSLDYGSITQEPLVGVAWQVLLDGELADEGVTDGAGTLRFSAPARAPVELLLLAEAPAAGLTVVDNTRDFAIYAHIEPLVMPEEPGELDVRVGLDHDGVRYTDRSAAPFAILSTLRRVSEAVLDAAGGALDPLTVHWSVDNIPSPGNRTAGRIGTSFYASNTGIWLLGAEDVDTDELDEAVLAHEWFHFYEDTRSRADTRGGTHGPDVVLHPAVAFSEGSVTALGCASLGIDHYTDTLGSGQVGGFTWALDTHRAGEAVGFFGSRSVASVVWDLVDEGPEDDDGLAYGLGGLLSVWEDELVLTPSVSSIYALGAAVRARSPGDAAALDALFAKEDIAPAVDPWGTGETNDGGVVGAVDGALVPEILLDEEVVLVGLGPRAPGHQLQEYRFRRFTAPFAGAFSARIDAGEPDVDLRVFLRGARLCAGLSPDGEERCEFSAEAGDTVLIEVDGGQHNEAVDVPLWVEAR